MNLLLSIVGFLLMIVGGLGLLPAHLAIVGAVLFGTGRIGWWVVQGQTAAATRHKEQAAWVENFAQLMRELLQR